MFSCSSQPWSVGLYLFSSLSIMSFLTQKGPKTSAHGRCIHKCFLFMPRASFSQPLVRHGSLWFVCRVLRNSLHAGLGDNIYPRYAQTSSHNGLQPAPATIEHLNGAGFAFGDELPLLLKVPIHNSAGLFLRLLLQGYSKGKRQHKPTIATRCGT